MKYAHSTIHVYVFISEQKRIAIRCWWHL